MTGDAVRTGEQLVEALLAEASPTLAPVLERAVSGRVPTVQEAESLFAARGRDLLALVAVADHVRRVQVGDAVSYVVNRNINFTNVCVMSCKFCAFSRTRRSSEGYYLDTAEIIRRAREAQDLGATELCIQAGLPPDPPNNLYIDLIVALKAAVPNLHLHALSPEEIKYGAGLRGLPVAEFLAEAKAAGLGSVPGTSAEILDDSVRKRLAGSRISTDEWIEVITSAHRVGLPTTATIMYGHVDTPGDWARHLELLRRLQLESGGFTEFVPLSFVHSEAPLHVKRMLPGVRPGPSGDDAIRMIAVSRLVLGDSFRNIQTSWVKEGIRLSQWLLACGANDLGGTLINESISLAAGAGHGQLQSPADLRRVIRDAGRLPVQRNTRYEPVRTFSADGDDDPCEALDGVDDPDARFGSYHQLTKRAARGRA
ncbi:MAG: 5-amino-6-(D-ribitylamino)uracil--L-tyrosine 4-hydroxyphenyl transferase CofH [Myxococcales bacterium]|nr:5-amino-6-(D-ribitylamino)uracil--L-tyrosine 4-hydroxyphenyl transferase CofH [Myxococcales bacterium]